MANSLFDDDCYGLLGVEPTATVTEIRRAWRRLARRWHPDRAGARTTRFFQKLSAAYEVLSDPAKRAAYDRRPGTPAARPAPRPAATGPKPPASPRRPAPPVLLSRLSGSLNTLLACGAAQYAGDNEIELLLNAQEAAQGGMVSISLWVPIRCPGCAASTSSSCARCGAARTLDELFTAWLAVPPGVADGAELIPSASLEGMIRPVSFRVRLEEPGT